MRNSNIEYTVGGSGICRHKVKWLQKKLKRKGKNLPQGDYDGRGQPTASPMLTAIMSGGVEISGRELYKYR